MSVKIVTVATSLPPYSRETAAILPFLEVWLADQDPRFIKKVTKIFEGAQVDRRYSIMEPEEVFTKTSFEARNQIYVREAIKLGQDVLQKALTQAKWQPEELDYIVTVSCTGIMIPSLDAYLINILGLRQDIVRLPVTEMGCVGGVSGMIYAKNFLKANPHTKAAVITVESPTATLQLDDFSMANMVSAAIFGDGAACVLLSSHEADKGPIILDDSMYHFYDNEHMMGFELTNSGLKMVLDIEVPETISEHFPKFIHPFLAKNQLTIHAIDHFIFHPGGKKIVKTVEALFAESGKNIDDTKEVLRQYGNMSSATILYVLERFLNKNTQSGEKGLLLSFGPGFTAQRMLIEF
ncbi:type III polyketide synthase [Flavobacterium orientale]|uniref:Chalcone synthase n=1 Tax=Flavobacterium orientale TaxID=1756020 RepID=A0A917DAT2_9FLAO|nr:type III polyketide synthase [Flavobacterium orientale]GGD24051.1 putative chalcone synthase [Flavobacterium orientale]